MTNVHYIRRCAAFIDSIKGTEEEHKHILGLSYETDMSYRTEDKRASRLWLYTSNPKEWGASLETLLVLKPQGGAYRTHTFENLMLRAEETLAHLNNGRRQASGPFTRDSTGVLAKLRAAQDPPRTKMMKEKASLNKTLPTDKAPR